MYSKTNRLTSVLLLAAWLAVAGWQYTAHRRTCDGLRDELRRRAEDISRAIAVVIRADGRFDAVPIPRVEAALEELTASTDLRSVSIRDVSGAVAAEAGPGLSLDLTDVDGARAVWLSDSAIFVNFVALGSLDNGRENGRGPRGERRGPPRPEDPGEHGGPGGPDGPDGPGGPGGRRGGHGPDGPPPLPPELRDAIERHINGAALTDSDIEEIIAALPGFIATDDTRAAVRKAMAGHVLTPERVDRLHELLLQRFGGRRPGGGPGPRWRDDERAGLLDKRSVHAFVLEIPALAVYVAENADRRMRLMLVALVAAIGGAVFYLLRTLRRSATLGVRLAKSEAFAEHLRELNTAAAGLVHETKNPLNLIRGLAQMIGREGSAEAAGRETALRIMEEADRLTGRLNQFLEYSRPPEPQLSNVLLENLVNDVFAVLACDREEKKLAFSVTSEGAPEVRADGEMLRQAVFNLLLNATEASPEGGEVAVVTGASGHNQLWLEVRDSGAGVPSALGERVFQPYVTGTATGTGLGLTIVRQIALAHGWRVTWENSPTGGAVFRISGMERA